MIASITLAVKTTIETFLTSYYAAGTDANANTPIYVYEEFDPTNEFTYSRVLNSSNYSIVIHDIGIVNRADHPHTHLKAEYSCSISIVRKTVNLWNTEKRWDGVIMGSSSSPAINSMFTLASNIAKYLRANSLLDRGVYWSYWQDVEIVPSIFTAGDFKTCQCRLKALHMESKTISVTPV